MAAMQTTKRKMNYQQLQQELAQSEAELDIINAVQDGLATHLEMQAIFDLVGNKIRDFFDAQVVMISTYDAQTHTVEHRYAIEAGQQIYFPGPHPPGGFRSRIIQTRRPLLVNVNVAEEAARLGQPTIPGTVTPKSWLGVPMIVNEQVTGILSLQNIEVEHAFRKTHVRLLQTLAASMSVALENARLWEQENLYRQALEREFEIGRQIQAGFLPDEIPQPAGWEIAASLQPAREVAGDFYDTFTLPGGQIGLAIADVCDKGLGAALFMTLFRSLLRAASNTDFYIGETFDRQKSSAERLKNAFSLTNNYIAETHGDTGMFATIFFGILNQHTGRLTYINGGHLPPLLINRGGIRQVLSPTGPAVGVVSNYPYIIQDVYLEPGDVLFAYTDGLTDTVNPAGEPFDDKGLVLLFIGQHPLPALLQDIQNQVSRFTAGAHQMDDITLLAVRRF